MCIGRSFFFLIMKSCGRDCQTHIIKEKKSHGKFKNEVYNKNTNQNQLPQQHQNFVWYIMPWLSYLLLIF